MSPRHVERHVIDRIGWLRAAVLGANDGIVSTASLMLGVAAAEGGVRAVLTAGVAGLVAGAMSMAAGEFVSVSSQSDAEAADLARERRELAEQPEAERAELAGIYVRRGLDPVLAEQVADQLMAHDALGAHARDELHLAEEVRARPVQAALASAASFAAGGVVPLLVGGLAPASATAPALATASLAALGVLGVLGAQGGGASAGRAAVRVVVWGAFAMAVTAGVGRLIGVAV